MHAAQVINHDLAKAGLYNAKLVEIDLPVPGCRGCAALAVSTSPAGVLVGVVVRPAVAK